MMASLQKPGQTWALEDFESLPRLEQVAPFVYLCVGVARRQTK